VLTLARRQTILIVEDNRKTASSLQLYLQHGGYRVLLAETGHEALETVRKCAPDLVILDWLLPGLSGIAVCRALREESSVPIVMLTARTTEEDRLCGLNLGADDYVTKPFSPREVVARVRAILRRAARAEDLGPAIVSCGEIALDRKRYKASIHGRLVALTATEFRLLDVLLRSPGRVFTRDELVEQALGRNSESLDRTVDAHVKNLRAKLERGGAKASVISTVYGVGYKLVDTTDDE
jgi:DNA-binding response OmpR family regulator